MAGPAFPSATTTVTSSYTVGSNSIVIGDTTVFAGAVTPYTPVYTAFYRGGFLLTAHNVTGITGSTLKTTGPVAPYADVALLAGDIVRPYASATQLAKLMCPPVPGGFPQVADSPGNHGYAEWSFPPYALGTAAGATATNGTLYIAKYVPQTVTTVSTISVILGTAGTTPTAADNWIGLFNAAGTSIAVSADQTTAFATAGIISAAMTTPVVVVPGSTYYIGFVNTAGTAAKLLCATAVVTSFNLGFATTTLPYATNGTSVTSWPASITPSSNVVTNALAYFWGINATATS